MNLDPRQKAKFRRVIGYAGVALIAAWSLLALATYAGIEAAVGWMAGIGAADGLLAWFAHMTAPIDGPVVAIVWLLGVALFGGLTIVMRRLTASLG